MPAMAPRQLLYVCPHGLIAARRRRDGWQVTGRFAATDGAGFAAWLRRHPDDRFDLLVDVQEEEQHLERLPRLGARDLRLLVKRRVEQRFRDTEFSLVTPLAPLRAGWALPVRGQPSEDGMQPMLVSAIRGGDALAPWLPALRGAERAVASMVSPALLGALAVRRIARGANVMLVSLAPGGLRQTLVVGGRLRFSRLAASIDGRDPDAVQAELTRTLQYLRMGQVLPSGRSGSGLAVWLVPDGLADAARIVAGLAGERGLHLPVVSYPLSRFRVSPVVGEGAAATGALALWLDAPLRQPLGAGYAHAALRRFDTLAGWRRALWATGGVAATGAAIALAGAELVASGGAGDLRPFAPSASFTAEMNRLQREIATHPLTGSEIEATVLGAEALERRAVDAPALLRAIGAAMPDDDALRLTRIAWSRVPAGGAAASEVGDGTGGEPAADAGAPASAAAPQPAAVVAFLTPVEVQIGGTVDARRSKTQANALVERLATALALGCGCEVAVRRWPYEHGPQASWGGTPGRDGALPAVEFALVLTRPERLEAVPETRDVASR